MTTLLFSGRGDVIRAFDPHAWTGDFSGLPGTGGALVGFPIDGSGADRGSSGIRYGDLMGGVIANVRIQNFAADDSIGLWLDCAVTWAERSRIEVELDNNATNVVFDSHARDGPRATIRRTSWR